MHIIISGWAEWLRINGSRPSLSCFRHTDSGRDLNSVMLNLYIDIYSPNQGIFRFIADTTIVREEACILTADEFVGAWDEAQRRAGERNSPPHGELQLEPMEDYVPSVQGRQIRGGIPQPIEAWRPDSVQVLEDEMQRSVGAPTASTISSPNMARRGTSSVSDTDGDNEGTVRQQDLWYGPIPF